MIVIPERLSWYRLFFRMRDTVNLRIYPRILFILLLSSLITWLHEAFHWFEQSLTPLPFTFVGLAVSIFLGFRNTASYERFWEGRKLWGQLINTSRNLARQSLSLLQTNTDEAELKALQQQLVRYIIANAYALRHGLRGDLLEDASRWLSPADAAELTSWQNPALLIQQKIAALFQQAYQRGWVHAQHLPLLEQNLAQLTDIQGGCERIRNTPIPFAYIVLLHQLVGIYCLALPFGVIDSLGLYTPFVVVIVGYAFLGLDAIGDSIENPFELENHDLPLSGMCRTIEINLLQMAGEKNLPAALQPNENWVLL